MVKIGLWICPPTPGFAGLALKLIRKFCAYSGPWVTKQIAAAIVPLLKFLPVRSGVNLSNSSWEHCLEIVLVNIEPKELVYPKLKEVVDWVEATGLQIDEISKDDPITIWATKKENQIDDQEISERFESWKTCGRIALVRKAVAPITRSIDNLIPNSLENHNSTPNCVIICSPPRSGSTAVYQILARALPCATVTNLHQLFPRNATRIVNKKQLLCRLFGN